MTIEIALGIAAGLGIARLARVGAPHLWTAIAGRTLPADAKASVPPWWYFLDELLGPAG